MKLYEITNQIKELENIEDLADEVLADTLESLTADFDSKSLSVAHYFLNVDSDVEKLKEAEKRIADRRKAIERKSESLKNYLISNMQRLGINKIECPEFSIALRKPLEVVECDVYQLDQEYVITKKTRTPDKRLIKAAIKNGYDVKGARLTEGKAGLIIK